MKAGTTEQNPILVSPSDAKEIRGIITLADREYAQTKSIRKKMEIRETARAKVLKRWPMLFDNCHVLISQNIPDSTL
jgi:hypothetical protein